MRLTVSFLLGSAILPFAFLSSMMSSVGVLGSESHHLVVILEANPQGYLNFVWMGAVNGILITASIALLIIALLKEGSPMRFRNCLPLIVGGVVLILWGALYIRSSHFYYFDVLNFARNWPVENVDSYVLSIYAAYGLVGVLWILVGALLAVIYPLKTLYRRQLATLQEPHPRTYLIIEAESVSC